MPEVLSSTLLGQSGVYRLLEDVLSKQEFRESDLPSLASEHRIESVEILVGTLIERMILQRSGPFIYLTDQGRKAWHLLRGINGANLVDVIHHLTLLDPGLRNYEIVREGMTTNFISGLLTNPDFKRILICSPWLHIREKLFRRLHHAVYLAQEKTKVEIVVISRPLNEKVPGYQAFLETFQALVRLGAEIVTHNSLHAKLYNKGPRAKGWLKNCIVRF